MNEVLKRLLEKQTKRFLSLLAEEIENNPKELINCLNDLIGCEFANKFIRKCEENNQILGFTSAALHALYSAECKAKGLEPLYINNFTRLVRYATGYNMRTVNIGGTTAREFIE